MNALERLADTSPFFQTTFFGTDNGAVVVNDQTAARQIVADHLRRQGDVPSFNDIEESLSGSGGPIPDNTIRAAIEGFAGLSSAPVRVSEQAVPFDPSTIDTGSSSVSCFDEQIRVNIDRGTFGDFSSEPAGDLLSDETFIVNGTGSRTTVQLFASESRNDPVATAILPEGGASEFIDRLRTTGQSVTPADLGLNLTGPSEATQDRRTRRDIREAAREQIEADPDTSLDEVSIDARAGDNPSIIVQDPETNETESIDLEDTSESGIEPAVESIDTGSEPEPASNESTSSPASGADGLGQVGGIVLVAAIGTAVYYGVTQL